MPRSRIIIIIALLIALLPALGFPRAWESFFQVVGGFSIIGLSIWTTIDRKLSMKAKAQMRQARRREPVSETPAEVMASEPVSSPEQFGN